MNPQSLNLTPTRQQVKSSYPSFIPDLTPVERSPFRAGAAVHLDKFFASQTCPSDAFPPPEQPPVGFRQIVFFIAFVIVGVFFDTIFAVKQSLKCTCVLLLELPKLWINTISILVPLWLTAVGVVPLVVKACVCKFTLKAADRLCLCVERLLQLWTSLRGSPVSQLLLTVFRLLSLVFRPLFHVFRLLASVCSAAAPSSVGPSVPSSRIRSLRPGAQAWNKYRTSPMAARSTRKVSWAGLPNTDRSSLD